MRRAERGRRLGVGAGVATAGFGSRPVGYQGAMLRRLLIGAAAGAAATTALNAVTYLDMLIRARPASDTPERTAQALADLAHLEVPGQPEQRQARLSAIGALAGILTGVGIGALYGLTHGLGMRRSTGRGAVAATATVLVAANGPMVLLGVTNPRTWSASDWLADVIPHVAYGAVTAATFAAATNPARKIPR